MYLIFMLNSAAIMCYLFRLQRLTRPACVVTWRPVLTKWSRPMFLEEITHTHTHSDGQWINKGGREKICTCSHRLSLVFTRFTLFKIVSGSKQLLFSDFTYRQTTFYTSACKSLLYFLFSYFWSYKIKRPPHPLLYCYHYYYYCIIIIFCTLVHSTSHNSFHLLVLNFIKTKRLKYVKQSKCRKCAARGLHYLIVSMVMVPNS